MTPSIDTSRLTQSTAKSAFEAWQAKDLPGWRSHFAAGAALYDDGSPRDFQAFSKEIGKERFTSIDRVDDDGTRITGHFHSDTWGNFTTFFKFHLNADGKITRLDIGQAG